MTETLTSSNLYNSFAVFREILQGITALTDLNSNFSSDDFYHEDEPNPKTRNFRGYPLMVIDTDVNDEPLTLGGAKKKFPMTTEIEIRTESSAKTDSDGNDRSNGYANAIVDYFNTNQPTLYSTYGITQVMIDKERSKEVLHDNKIVIITLTFKYRRILAVR